MPGGSPGQGLPIAGANGSNGVSLAGLLSTEAKVGIGFLVAFLVISLITWIGFGTLRAYQSDSSLVVHTRQVMEVISDMDAALAQAASSQRTYLLTVDASYLDHGLQALERVRVLRSLLQQLMTENVGKSTLLPRLDARIQSWLETLEQNRTLLAREERGSKVMRERMALLWSLRDDVHETLAELRQHQTELLAVRQAAAAERSDEVAATFIGLLIAVSAMLLWLYPRIRTEIAERRSAQERTYLVNERLRLRGEELVAVNQELEAFTYSVSHDLRAPARAIDGFARIIEEDHATQLDAEGRRLLGVVRGSSQKMGKLIDDLLEFSRLGRKSLVQAPVDMRELVQRVLETLVPAEAAHRPALTLGAIAPAHGDADTLLQVWTNLIDNAIKYSARSAAPQIHIDSHESGGEIVYRVRDNGAGFDMRFYEKLFGVFQRLHGATEFPGTGVGLAIVKRVVERHGGRVWAEGAPERGATFYFSMPRGPR